MALVRVGSHRARSKLETLCGGKCRHRYLESPGEFWEIPDELLAEARKITGVTHVRKDPDEKRRVAREKNKTRMISGVRELVRRIGGQESEGLGTTEFVVNTKYGLLRISPYDTWIATRFDEPSRGRAVGANDYTGKWNFHSSGKSEQDLHDLFNQFSTSLLRIV